MELKRIPLIERGKLSIWALEIDGRSEVTTFLKQQLLDDPLLFARLRDIFAYVAETGTAAGGQWMRQLRSWPQQWEIRQGRHRFMGFATGRELVLCLYRLKQGQEPARQDLERVERLRQEWSKRDE